LKAAFKKAAPNAKPVATKATVAAELSEATSATEAKMKPTS
jgi:hypothetical protein